MEKFKKPQAIVENGETKFILWDGTKTKAVYSFYEFNDVLGGFIILNDKHEEVEFMDCVGNFTKQPTIFAKHFNRYINSTGGSIIYGSPYFEYVTSLVDFPSKYLTDKKIRKIVKNEENYKIYNAKQNKELDGLLDIVVYRCYVNNVYKQKIKKAQKFLENLKTKQDIENFYYEL